MDYTFIAIMRNTEERIELAKYSNLEFFERIMSYFTYSDNIASFAVYKGDMLIAQKVLSTCSKSLIRRK